MSRPFANAAARRVPTVSEVVAGARVNIVLKADQPTGRTVTGTVRDVLTRGNHPRGIKVRLADGRVGRVQTLATGPAQAEEASTASAGDAQGILDTVLRSEGGGPGQRPRREGGGWRGDDGNQEPPRQEVGLDAYIRPPRPNRRQRRGVEQSTEGGRASQDGPAGSETVTCPVCGSFEGDEAAVTHHISSHFDA